MPITLPANIQQAQQSSQTALKTAGEMASSAYTIPDILKKKINEALNYNQDIVGPLDTATQDYMASPSVGREKYQDIWNPFQRESLVSKYVGNQAIPMLTLSSILGQRMGNVQDFIGAGTNAFKAQASAAENAAKLERQNYEDLLGQYKWDYEQTHKGTGTESAKKALVVSELISDLRRGATLDQAMLAYRMDLDPNEILSYYKTYNVQGEGGQAKAPVQGDLELFNRYGITIPGGTPRSEEANGWRETLKGISPLFNWL